MGREIIRSVPAIITTSKSAGLDKQGMAIAQANAADTEIGMLAFASNGTTHPDAFVVINIADSNKEIEIECLGTEVKNFEAFRTSPQENYSSIGPLRLTNKVLTYTVPAGSVTTFFAKDSV